MDSAHTQTVFRFAFGVTLAFVAAELMKWTVPFLAPVLTCVVLANIPVRPPLKVALGFSLVIGGSALLGLLLSYAFRGAPHILFGAERTHRVPRAVRTGERAHQSSARCSSSSA